MRFVIHFSLAICLAVLVAMSAFRAAAEDRGSADAPKEPIAQKCLDNIHAFDEQLWRVGFGVLSTTGVVGNQSFSEHFYGYGVGPTPRRRIRMLYSAALAYAYAGSEQLCEQTLSSMKAVYEQHQKLIGSEADDPNIASAWKRAHLVRAKPIADMNHLMQASVLIGAEILNLQDQLLGEITDIVLNPEQPNILYVIASRGGFLGFGGKLLAVRWMELRATEDHELYVLDVAPKAFDEAPTVNRANLARTADPAWQHTLTRSWDIVLKK